MNDKTPVDKPMEVGYPFEPGEREWVELAGFENMKSRRAAAATLAEQVSATLTILLAGLGGSLAYAVKILDGDFALSSVAAFGAAAWFAYLAARLTQGCMMIRDIDAVYNDPGNLLMRPQRKDSFVEWRYGEILNLDERIKNTTSRNELTGSRLNVIRLATTGTPIVAIVAATAFVQCA